MDMQLTYFGSKNIKTKIKKIKVKSEKKQSLLGKIRSNMNVFNTFILLLRDS